MAKKRERGKPGGSPLKHVWIQPDLHRRFKLAVTEDGTTMTAKLEALILQYLGSRRRAKR